GQELGIRPVCRLLPQHRLAKMPHHRVHLSRRHACPPWPVAADLYRNCPTKAEFIHFFLPPSQPQRAHRIPYDGQLAPHCSSSPNLHGPGRNAATWEASPWEPCTSPSNITV